MGNKESSRPEEDIGYKESNSLASIPPDSPLGRMLKDWKGNPCTRHKNKKKMVKYCCSVWTRESIGPSTVFWPKYGSEEGRLCQMLNIYVFNKLPFCEEECDYSSCWEGSGNVGLFDHPTTTVGAPKRGKEGAEPWDSSTQTLYGPQGQEGAPSLAVCLIDQVTVGPRTPLELEPEPSSSDPSHPGLRREVGPCHWKPWDFVPPSIYQGGEEAPRLAAHLTDPERGQATVGLSSPVKPTLDSIQPSHPGLRREVGLYKKPWDPQDFGPPPPYQEEEEAPSPAVHLIDPERSQATVGPSTLVKPKLGSSGQSHAGSRRKGDKKGVPNNFPFPDKNRESSSVGRQDRSNEERFLPRQRPISSRPPAFVEEPLTSSEVMSFKQEMKSLTEDPAGLAEQLDQFLGSNLYTWNEMMSILSILFSREERELITEAALKEWEKRHPPGVGATPAEDKVPKVDPGWVTTNPLHRIYLGNFRKLIIQGIREAVPNNMNKVLEISQGKEESPSAFLERLKDQVRKCCGKNAEEPVVEDFLKVQFVTKAWPDIRKKILETEGWSYKTLADLLREAQKVFVRREEEELKKKAKMLVSLVNQVVKETMEPAPHRGRGSWVRSRGGPGRGRGGAPGPGPDPFGQPCWTTSQAGRFHYGRGGPLKWAPPELNQKVWDQKKVKTTGPLAKDQCAICRERGHWKNECPRGRRGRN
ncbi:uncharacterized protein LOC113425509 [Notechis scutatus]|uniref:Uncharacterized protein LOC113425509 n=1 Tax=Notechis scutatus TaxID=8663 RepID=A0A6J1VKD3_9SAUR|nr:uncharacterized protein LOC113425509 [Notechis scutatus]